MSIKPKYSIRIMYHMVYIYFKHENHIHAKTTAITIMAFKNNGMVIYRDNVYRDLSINQYG